MAFVRTTSEHKDCGARMFQLCVFDMSTMWPIYSLAVIWGTQLMLLLLILVAGDHRAGRSAGPHERIEISARAR